MFEITKKRFMEFLSLQLIFMFYSLAGVTSKKASQYSFMSMEYIMILGIELVILFVYAIFWQQVIKKFDLSVAYSNRGVIIIWTFIWSIAFFNESVTVNNIIGAAIIILGIIKVSQNDE